jgi:hypothetical protein
VVECPIRPFPSFTFFLYRPGQMLRLLIHGGKNRKVPKMATKMLGKFTQTKNQKVTGISAIFIPVLSSEKTSLKCTNSVGVALLNKLGIGLDCEVVVEIGSRANEYNGTTTQQMTINLVSDNPRVIGKLAERMDYVAEDVTFAKVGAGVTSHETPPSDPKIGERILSLKGADLAAYNKAKADPANAAMSQAELLDIAGL